MWIWQGNGYVKLINAIETAIEDIRTGKCAEIIIPVRFDFMKSPPTNKFEIIIKPVEAKNEGKYNRK
jgi:hypothetical protein